MDDIDKLTEIGETIEKSMQELNKISEEKYNALSEEDRLDLFCAIVSRIHDGEIKKSRSYRGMLYDVFGFDYDSYTRGMYCGYMDLHNSIVKDSDLKKMIRVFIESELKLKDVDEKVNTFMRNRYNYLYAKEGEDDE